MRPDEAADLIGHLQSSREHLLSVVAGVSEEQFKRRPPDAASTDSAAWSIAEVLAHLLATEQRVTAEIEGHVSGTDAGPASAFDDDRDARARLGRTVPVPQIIHGLLAARRSLERNLAADMTVARRAAVEALVRHEIIEHETDHAAHIEAIRTSLGANRTNPR